MQNVQFYHCPLCGQVVEVVNAGKGTLVCCQQEMEALIANTRDAATEKHVPVITRKDGKIIVKVGSVSHPMTEEHLIQFIVLVTEKGVCRVNLTAADAPEAVFPDVEGKVVAYEYCNLHGLWKAEA